MAQWASSFTPTPSGQYAMGGAPAYGQGLSVQVPEFQPPAPAFNAPQLRAQTFASAATTPGTAAGAAAQQNLTAGLPNPDQIQKQKEGYTRLLDEQLKQGKQTLDQQCKQQTDYLHQQAQQQKQQVKAQIKQQVQQQEMEFLQQYNQQLMQAQTQAAHQKAALEQQAMLLTMEFQQKKSQEEMMFKQQQLQREHMEAQMKFAAQMQKLQGPSGMGQY